MKGIPTERQAATAARQLHYHRERLRWIRDRMRDNEALLLSYLTRLDAEAAVLPGGYEIAGERASPPEDVAVRKLTPESPYEQLALRIGERGITREMPPETPPASEEPRKATTGGGLGEAMRLEEGSTYAERECGRCLGGMVHVGSPTEVKTAPCPTCKGTGRVLSYLYPKPKGRRGPWPPEEAAEGRRARGAQ